MIVQAEKTKIKLLSTDGTQNNHSGGGAVIQASPRGRAECATVEKHPQ